MNPQYSPERVADRLEIQDAQLVKDGPALNPLWTLQRRDSEDTIMKKRRQLGLAA